MENSQEQLTQPKQSFFSKVWQGNLALWKIYWIGGVLGFYVIKLLFRLLQNAVENQDTWVRILFGILYSIGSNYAVIFSLLLIDVIVWMYMLFILVGIWRSAKKYTGSRIWTLLAYATVIVNVLVSCVTIPTEFIALNSLL